MDNQLVVPAGKKIRILTTSGDVIHSFFIPSLGVQRYAIPGRTIETWVEVDKPGDYYGECNQICGTNHSHMPIAVHAVTPDEFTDLGRRRQEEVRVEPACSRPPAVRLAGSVAAGARDPGAGAAVTHIAPHDDLTTPQEPPHERHHPRRITTTTATATRRASCSAG